MEVGDIGSDLGFMTRTTTTLSYQSADGLAKGGGVRTKGEVGCDGGVWRMAAKSERVEGRWELRTVRGD